MAEPADDDAREALARDAWLAIVRIFRSQDAADLGLRAADELDLPIRQFWVLLALPLAEGEGRSMSQLAENCFSTRSYMTVIVDTLEDRGLVTRRTDPDDRRVKLVSLTAAGLAAVNRSHEILSDPPRGIRALSRDQLQALRDLLEEAAAPYDW